MQKMMAGEAASRPAFHTLETFVRVQVQGFIHTVLSLMNMACSLPVISTSEAGEIPDRIEEGVNGFIVPPEDARALAERMGVLARDREGRRRMGAASFDKIKDHTPEGWARDFEAANRQDRRTATTVSTVCRPGTSFSP